MNLNPYHTLRFGHNSILNSQCKNGRWYRPNGRITAKALYPPKTPSSLLAAGELPLIDKTHSDYSLPRPHNPVGGPVVVGDTLDKALLGGLNSTRDTDFATWDSVPEAAHERAVGAAAPVQTVVGCHGTAVD